jgi:translation elongation factor EF-1alpha
LHIHAVVEECEIVELLQQIDPKTKKPMRKRVLFVKNGAIVLCRIQVGFFALLVRNFTQHFLLENFETIINVILK